MKKIMIVLLLSAALCSMTACQNNEEKNAEEQTIDEADEDMSASEDGSTRVGVGLNHDTDEEIEYTDEEDTPAAVQNDWMDFKNMTFYVYKNPCTLGVSTLQDLVDAGLVIQSEYEHYMDDTIEYEQTITIQFNEPNYDASYAAIYNGTNSSGLPGKDCLVTMIGIIKNDDSADIISFDFPTDMTYDEMVSVCGKPNRTYEDETENEEEYLECEYNADNASASNSHKYIFVFVDGVLREINLQIPTVTE